MHKQLISVICQKMIYFIHDWDNLGFNLFAKGFELGSIWIIGTFDPFLSNLTVMNDLKYIVPTHELWCVPSSIMSNSTSTIRLYNSKIANSYVYCSFHTLYNNTTYGMQKNPVLNPGIVHFWIRDRFYEVKVCIISYLF